MIVCRGDIWLVNFNPVKKANEVGKIRPALVLQNDELNSGGYKTTIVLPLSTHLIDEAEPLRYRILKREKLMKDSDILVAHVRSIDNARLNEKIASLSQKELSMVKNMLDEVLS